MSGAEAREVSQEELLTATQNQTNVTKCPSCGANLLYDIDTKGLKCPYCGKTVEVSFDNLCHEIDFSKLFDSKISDWGDETHVFRCNNCGAREVLLKTEISKNCAFCGTTNVVESNEISGLRPNAVLPFLIGKEKASENVVHWAKKKLFAPKKFKASVTPEEIYGNYSPAFTFDSYTTSSYRGELGEYYYVNVRVNGKNVRQRKIRWFIIGGVHDSSFDDVLIQASSSVNQKTVAKLEPFNTNNAQEYSINFLQGFSATQYTKDGKVCWSEAQNLMRQRIKQQILSKYRYDVVKSLDFNTSYSGVTFKYLLLPIYVGHCNYAQKLYNFFVNGQSGKVTGKTPISWIKVGLVSLAALALIILIFILMNGGNAS